MKIYTKTGDAGKTGLFSGERVPKSHARIEAYGDVDELNSILGALAAALPERDADLIAELRAVQGDLFRVGSHLATTPDSMAAQSLRPLGGDAIHRLESSIDRWTAELPPLDHFVLPGGHPTAAWAHLARTVCRRAERRAVRLLDAEGRPTAPTEAEILAYLNRLSDYLFVLARVCNHRTGTAETEWQP
jgi:cob(I)alamin adenosyltransferase